MLNQIVAIAKLSSISRVFGSESRARTSSEFPLHELAFDCDPLSSPMQENIHIGRSRLIQNANFMFELK